MISWSLSPQNGDWITRWIRVICEKLLSCLAVNNFYSLWNPKASLCALSQASWWAMSRIKWIHSASLYHNSLTSILLSTYKLCQVSEVFFFSLQDSYITFCIHFSQLLWRQCMLITVHLILLDLDRPVARPMNTVSAAASSASAHTYGYMFIYVYNAVLYVYL